MLDVEQDNDDRARRLLLIWSPSTYPDVYSYFCFWTFIVTFLSFLPKYTKIEKELIKQGYLLWRGFAFATDKKNHLIQVISPKKFLHLLGLRLALGKGRNIVAACSSSSCSSSCSSRPTTPLAPPPDW